MVSVTRALLAQECGDSNWNVQCRNLALHKTEFGTPNLVELIPYVERHRAETQSANGHWGFPEKEPTMLVCVCLLHL